MLSNLEDNSNLTGTFQTKDKEVNGTLTLDGVRSNLHLWADHEFEVNSVILGILNNNKKVTLLDCVVRQARWKNNSYSLYIFPHQALLGYNNISDTDDVITASIFTTDDTNLIFFDRQSFKITINAYLIKKKDKSGNLLENVELNDGSLVAYYTGKSEIFSAKTSIGKVSACHNITFDKSSIRVNNIVNKVIVKIEFCEANTFENARFQVVIILFFLGLIMGRLQNITLFKIKKNDCDGVFDVYDNMFTKYKKSEIDNNRYHETALIDANREPNEFSKILTNWMMRGKSWELARSRFFEGWGEHRGYDKDRLIRAASLFDLIPKEEFQKGQCSKWILKKKILHRSKVITSEIEQEIPEITNVIEKAVDCRNYYVHGPKKVCDNFDKKYQQSLIFFITTLEFVFATSDLIDMGWNIKGWIKKKAIVSHPFKLYLYSYKSNICQFKKVFKS